MHEFDERGRHASVTRLIVLVLTLALPAHVLAADFQVGMNAYKRGDYAAALEEWRPLAEQGDASAQVTLGSMYQHGEGVTQDYVEAVNWFRLAAEQGYAAAHHQLANMYARGVWVSQDPAEAAKWYRLAAEQGDADAQYYLGNMYDLGWGVPQDYVQAHMWLNLAVVGFPPGEDRKLAAGNRDGIETNMTPGQVAEAQRLASEWKPK